MLNSEKGLFKLKRFMLDQAVEKIAAETMETCEERDKTIIRPQPSQERLQDASFLGL